MDNLMLRRRLMMAAQGVWTTVTATTPFSVQNALKSKVKSLIQYGKMVQDGTPTPEAPVYPTINNGTVQMVHRSGLPSGYKLLEYVGSSGAAYILTDVFLASTDVVEAEFRNNSTTGYGSLYGIFKLGESSALYANQTYYGYDESNNKVDTDLRVNTEWHTSRHDFVNGTLTIDDTTVNFTPFAFVNSVQNAVLSRYYNNSYGYIWKGFIRKFKVTRGGEVICDLLPAKNEQDEAGFYDLISGNFYTATGGTLLEGSEVNDYEPAVVGTPEELSVSGINLFYNSEEWKRGVFLSNGKVSAAPANRTFVMRCSPNTTYYWKHCSLVGGIRAFTLDADTVKVGVDGVWIKRNPVFGEVNTVYSATTGANAKWLCVCFGRNDSSAAPIADQWSDFMLSTAPLTADTPYTPYTAQTASVVNLFAVGDYADSVDVVAGPKTRRVGCHVFDGTEAFSLSSGAFRTVALEDKAANTKVVCSHFDGDVVPTMAVSSMPDLSVKGYGPNEAIFFKYSAITTVADFKAFLADQYAQGKPVIAWYPLAEPVTESITPQALRTVKGVNVIHAATPVAPVSITMTYRAKRAA